jgi:hypothetical protein
MQFVQTFNRYLMIVIRSLFALVIILFSLPITFANMPTKSNFTSNYGYQINENNEIIFVPMQSFFDIYKVDADINSIKFNSENEDISWPWSIAIDKDHVFYKGSKLPLVDPNSVEFIVSNIFKDKNHVYWLGSSLLKCFDDFDPATFQLVGDNSYLRQYSKDKNGVYLLNQKLNGISSEGFEILDSQSYQLYIRDKNGIYIDNRIKLKEIVDPQSFTLIDFHYSFDKYYLYYHLRKIEGIADPQSFTTINKHYAKDKYNLYYQHKKVEGIADPQSFTFINNNYSKDKYNLYYQHKKIEATTDPQSFTAIDVRYAKDKYHVYYRNKIIEGADPNTFNRNRYATNNGYYLVYEDKNFEYCHGIKISASESESQLCNEEFEDEGDDLKYTIHNNFVYYQNEKLDQIDLNSLSFLGDSYAKDKNAAYYEGRPIAEEVDLDTFMRMVATVDYAQDKIHIYYKGKLIEGVDYATFELDRSNLLYSKDKNSVYYRGQKIVGANPVTFKPINDFYAIDDKFAYYKNQIILNANPKELKTIFNDDETAYDDRFQYTAGKITSVIDITQSPIKTTDYPLPRPISLIHTLPE